MILAADSICKAIQRLALLLALLAGAAVALPASDRPASAPSAIAGLAPASGLPDAFAEPGLDPADQQRTAGGPDDPAPVAVADPTPAAPGPTSAHPAPPDSHRSGAPALSYRARAPPRA